MLMSGYSLEHVYNYELNYMDLYRQRDGSLFFFTLGLTELHMDSSPGIQAAVDGSFP